MIIIEHVVHIYNLFEVVNGETIYTLKLKSFLVTLKDNLKKWEQSKVGSRPIK